MACGAPVVPPSSPAPATSVPRLLPPKPIDPAARGAAYLTAVALQLQPGWGQFLDDCRIRLPASHPLNAMTLAATAELVVERDGRVVDVKIESSGNAGYDGAVRDAIRDAQPLAPPPLELLSDDDRLHLRWLFARDRRQAGPATAQIVDVDLPMREVVGKRIRSGDLARAAQRISRAPLGIDREDATRELMIAVLGDALLRGDTSERKAAITAAGRARIGDLSHAVRSMLARMTELDVRLAAIDALVAIGDREAAHDIENAMPDDLRTQAKLALADARALAALGSEDAAIAAVRGVLDDPHATPDVRATALEVAGALPKLATALAPKLGRGDARQRAAACRTIAGATLDAAWTWLSAGLRDADASVRAACVEAAFAQATAHRDDRRLATLLGRFRELARDRDSAVRSRAIAALALDPDHLPRAIDDPAAEVRAAYATALTPKQAADLRTLLDDRDPDVRAAAWAREAQLRVDPEHDQRAAADPSPKVRLAALPLLDVQALAHDESPDVRGEAIVLYARKVGHPAVDRWIGRNAPSVAVAQAWLLLP